jgi:hypothetical protein
MNGSSGFGAMSPIFFAVAAGAAQQQQGQEEEEMTKYSDAELAGGWEFKIIRSNTGTFRKREVMERVCEEESMAGWVLVEKFDSRRLRFKRPASARAHDANLSFDPYRTHYGASAGTLAVWILIVSLLVTVGAGILVFTLAQRPLMIAPIVQHAPIVQQPHMIAPTAPPHKTTPTEPPPRPQ